MDFEIIDAPDAIVGWYILIRMELLECLENYIKRADITVADVVAVGEDVLTSLEVCEERNIIHRDIERQANLSEAIREFINSETSVLQEI